MSIESNDPGSHSECDGEQLVLGIRVTCFHLTRRMDCKGQEWKQRDQRVKERDAGLDYTGRNEDKDEGYNDLAVNSMGSCRFG